MSNYLTLKEIRAIQTTKAESLEELFMLLSMAGHHFNRLDKISVTSIAWMFMDECTSVGMGLTQEPGPVTMELFSTMYHHVVDTKKFHQAAKSSKRTTWARMGFYMLGMTYRDKDIILSNFSKSGFDMIANAHPELVRIFRKYGIWKPEKYGDFNPYL
jgi:hypothetical protein